eukprot:579997-Amphidinium_carterae.1
MHHDLLPKSAPTCHHNNLFLSPPQNVAKVQEVTPFLLFSGQHVWESACTRMRRCHQAHRQLSQRRRGHHGDFKELARASDAPRAMSKTRESRQWNRPPAALLCEQ